MAWIRSIRRLNGDERAPGRVALQYLSATLFEERRTTTKVGKKSGKEFKPADLSRHTCVYYRCRCHPRRHRQEPVLERVESATRNRRDRATHPRGQPNA